MTHRLNEIDQHKAFFLLKNCFSIPRWVYFLRTAPCFIKPEILVKFDQTIKSSLSDLLNLSLTDAAFDQASLPVANGGLGLRPASEIALPGFLSSVEACRPFTKLLLPQNLQDYISIHWNTALTQWKEKAGTTNLPDLPMYQSSWDKPLYEARFQNLLVSAQCASEKARLLAISSQSSSDWLHAMPLPSLGLHLDPSSLRIASALRLGLPLCQPYKCICGVMVEQNGRHGLSCKKQVGRISRHNEINDLIKRALVQANISAVTEPPGLFRSDGKRPDGMTHFPWKRGKNLVWDVTVCDTLCSSYVLKCSKSPSSAADTRETSKKLKYKSLAEDYHFTPIAIETFGAWGTESHKIIKEIGKKVMETTGEKRSTFYLTQRISIALMRGNAACILGTVPPTEGLEAIFDFIDHEAGKPQ